jgi:hypothetical protein
MEDVQSTMYCVQCTVNLPVFFKMKRGREG